MASSNNCYIDKSISPVIFLILFNLNLGSCFFFPQPSAAPPQSHQQQLFGYPEPPNQVGYAFKPQWADIHLQPLPAELPRYQAQIQPLFYQPPGKPQPPQPEPQPPQKENEVQPQLQKNNEPESVHKVQPTPQPGPTPLSAPESQFQPHPEPNFEFDSKFVPQIPEHQYTIPANTFLQPSEKYQIPPPKYYWSAEPSVKYHIPTLGNPLTYRDPHQNGNVLVPLRLFGVQTLPPFLERLIQRVQTYYSVYNPPETLTIPYGLNTPPTFTSSGLLPPGSDPFITPVDQSNFIGGSIPNIENNNVDNIQGAAGSNAGESNDNGKIGDVTTETSATNEFNNEETSNRDSAESTSSDDASKSEETKSDTDESQNGDSTTVKSEESDKSEEKNSTESNSEEQSSSVDASETTTAESS